MSICRTCRHIHSTTEATVIFYVCDEMPVDGMYGRNAYSVGPNYGCKFEPTRWSAIGWDAGAEKLQEELAL